MSMILTEITQSYQQATSTWHDYLFPVAQHLFGLLATIEIAWSGVLWAMHKSEESSIWIEFLKKMLTIGFFYTVLINSQTWIPMIIRSFVQIGAGASHITALYPSDILDQGISVAASVLRPLLDAGLLHAGIGLIVGSSTALIVVICFAIIAAELVVSLIESYVVVGAGVLLLGFSANRFTSAYSSKYLSYAISIGIKLFTLYLIIGVGSTLAANWGQLILQGGVKNIKPFLEVLGGSLVFCFVTKAIPNKAESLISGNVNSTGGALTAVAAGAGAALTRTAISSTQAGYEAVQQASMVSQSHANPVVGALKGIGTASMGLAFASAGSHSGYYSTIGSGMSQRTQTLRRNIAENMEHKVANPNQNNKGNS
jgi:type IV secretion system protein TrbL